MGRLETSYWIQLPERNKRERTRNVHDAMPRDATGQWHQRAPPTEKVAMLPKEVSPRVAGQKALETAPGSERTAMAYPARVRLPALLAAAQRALAAAAMRARPAALIFRLPRLILVGVFPLAPAQRARWAAAIRARVAADRIPPPRRPGEPPSTPLSSSANSSICSFRATARRSCWMERLVRLFVIDRRNNTVTLPGSIA